MSDMPATPAAAKQWTESAIVELLEKSDKAVSRALLVLYARQTADEQETQTTSHKNGQGFSAFDAEILSSFAQQVEKGRTLSPKQLALARKKLPRYRKQLLLVINSAK